MKAVILPSGDTGHLEPLTAWIPELLIPVVNKPIAEHLIELAVRHNIKEIIMVLKHMPYETEKYFLNGQRWGCNISYALIKDYEGIIRTLRHIRSRLDEPFICIPGNIVTNINITDLALSHAKDNNDITVPIQIKWGRLKDIEDSYPFIMNPEAISRFSDHAPPEKSKDMLVFLSESRLTVKRHYSLFDIKIMNGKMDFHEVNKLVLRGKFPELIIPGKQIMPGIWVGKQTRIQPDVKLSSPLIIGSHCSIQNSASIGEDSVIADNVVIDRGAVIKGSVILGNTYVGAHTEIADSIIMKNVMIQTPRMLNLYIGDDFILGDLDRKVIRGKAERLFNLLFSALLLCLFSPLMLILYLYHVLFPSKKYLGAEERYGSYERIDLQGNLRPKSFTFYFFRSRNRFINKLPGIINVIKNDINLVGVSALTKAEADSLKEEWQTLRFKAPAGLFHLWESEGDKNSSWDEKVVTENYYAATRSFMGDLKILFKNLFCIRPDNKYQIGIKPS